MHKMSNKTEVRSKDTQTLNWAEMVENCDKPQKSVWKIKQNKNRKPPVNGVPSKRSNNPKADENHVQMQNKIDRLQDEMHALEQDLKHTSSEFLQMKSHAITLENRIIILESHIARSVLPQYCDNCTYTKNSKICTFYFSGFP